MIRAYHGSEFVVANTLAKWKKLEPNEIDLIPLFHTGPKSYELPLIDTYLDSWLKRTQFVMVLTELHST